MSILTIIQDVSDLLSLSRPAAVLNAADVQTRQLLALAVEEANELNSRFRWQYMTREQTFVTTATAAQSTALPTDLKKFIHNSFYNRTTRRPVLGPVTPQVWQAIQANPAVNRIILAFRQRDGVFLVTPTPPADQTIAYEYVSTKWARSSDLATDYVKWQVDTDTSYFDEDLIKLGVRWRWKKSKGLPYGEDYDSYTSRRDELRAQDGGSSALDITGRGDVTYIGNPNVPESGFGA